MSACASGLPSKSHLIPPNEVQTMTIDHPWLESDWHPNHDQTELNCSICNLQMNESLDVINAVLWLSKINQMMLLMWPPILKILILVRLPSVVSKVTKKWHAKQQDLVSSRGRPLWSYQYRYAYHLSSRYWCQAACWSGVDHCDCTSNSTAELHP